MTPRYLPASGLQGVPFLLLVALCSSSHTVEAAGSVQQNPQPAPIEAALILLRWSPADTPAIVVVDERPEKVSVLAEAWTFFCADGCPQPAIYVAAWSELYRKALANPRETDRIIRLAGVLAHERAHLRHGLDEELAYAEQLTTLERLQAPPIDIVNVRRSLEAAKRKRGRH
jgi:hypothetical protein